MHKWNGRPRENILSLEISSETEQRLECVVEGNFCSDVRWSSWSLNSFTAQILCSEFCSGNQNVTVCLVILY